MTDSPPKIKHTLLILGILMLAAGAIGVIGLRLGIVQSILGDPDAYPGIGTAEPLGHVVSMVPFVLGLVTVAFWGIRNDPIYRELEKAKEEGSEEAEDADEEDEAKEEEEAALPPEEWEEPEEPEDEVQEAGPTVQKEKFEWEDEELPEPAPSPKPEIAPEVSAEANEIFAAIDELELEVASKPHAEIQTHAPAAKPDAKADKARVERCHKMLGFARVLDEDRAKLEALIDEGVSVKEFTERMKTAVERRKKKDEEAARTAEQKAAIIEDEVLDELLSLEDEIDEEEDLDDLILADLDDLDKELNKDE